MPSRLAEVRGRRLRIALYRPPVANTAVDLYGAAFVARSSHESGGHPVPRDEPGICGVAWADKEQVIRLLVTDDRGYSRLVAEVTGARQGVVVVFDKALRCHQFLRNQSGWGADRPATAMVLRDVRALPAATVPDGLVLRPVDRLASGARDTVPLEDAVAVAFASDPDITDSPAAFAGFLSGLPSVQLFAAVDDAGVARATSGCQVFGEYARVFFVNTEPGWRRRGIGRAMTLEALRAAASSGAHGAVLNATDDGTSVYTRLGFKPAGRLTRYSRSRAQAA
jgi:ribosomal protein S18 acetylase RimI-like enzyme